jgi:hypothetical protein
MSLRLSVVLVAGLSIALWSVVILAIIRLTRTP